MIRLGLDPRTFSEFVLQSELLTRCDNQLHHPTILSCTNHGIKNYMSKYGQIWA
jgi:hypothetical protein